MFEIMSLRSQVEEVISAVQPKLRSVSFLLYCVSHKGNDTYTAIYYMHGADESTEKRLKGVGTTPELAYRDMLRNACLELTAMKPSDLMI